MLAKPRQGAFAWVELLRLEYQGDNLLAWFTATALCAVRHPDALALGWIALGIANLVIAQMALELLDGYHDFRQGAHARKDGAPTWTGGSGVLAEGRVAPGHALIAAWTLGLIAVGLFGVLVIGRTGVPGLVIGAVGALAGGGWAMPPFKFSYRGVGEILVALVAGPAMTAQAWLVASGTLEWTAFAVGIPFGLLQFSMALAHGIVDHDADARVGKRTLVVRIGRQLAARLHAVSNLAVFVSVLTLFAAGVVSWPALVVLLALPLAQSSARSVCEAAASAEATLRLATAYPPYKLLVAIGLVLALGGLARASLELGALGASLLVAFCLLYAPVLALTLRRWRTS